MLKKAWNKIKSFGTKAFVATAAGAAVLGLASQASASGNNMSAVTSSITTEFTSIVTAGLVVLGAVAGAALILFGGIYAWRYGKKVFSVISK